MRENVRKISENEGTSKQQSNRWDHNTVSVHNIVLIKELYNSFNTSCLESHDPMSIEFEPPPVVYCVAATAIPKLGIVPRSDRAVAHV